MESISSHAASQKSLEKLEKDDAKSIIDDCVHYLLVASQKRLPIKRSNVTRLVCKGNNKITASVVFHASKLLRRHYGLDVGASEDKTLYFVYNMKKQNQSLVPLPADVCYDIGLLYSILTPILMSQDQKISEENIQKLFAKLEISEGDAFLDKFIKQAYLIMVKENEEKFYKWGPRTEIECDKLSMFEMFCRIDGSTPTDWPQHKRTFEELSHREACVISSSQQQHQSQSQKPSSSRIIDDDDD